MNGTIALLLAVAVYSVQPQTRDAKPTTKPSTTPAMSGTGAIAGKVTTTDESQPVRFAYVLLIGTGTGAVKVSSTDSDGQFSFTNLAADNYIVAASKLPYLGTIAGAKRPGRPGTPIAVATGQTVANVLIRMPLGAAIAGVISDERGQPAPNISVRLWQWQMQNGERVLLPAPNVPTGTTDDRGAYRFYGLKPGEYAISALRPAGPPPPRALTVAEVDAALKGQVVAPAPPPQAPRYVPIYFPGTPRSSDASAILLTTGEERPNVDFRLQLVDVAKVHGFIIRSDGTPLGDFPLPLFITSPTGMVTAPIVLTTSDGGFSYVAGPGQYTFQIRDPGDRGFLAGLSGLSASATIEVAGADVFDVRLHLQPSITLTGQLLFQGQGGLPALVNRQVPIRPLRSQPSSAMRVGLTTSNGSFTVTDVTPGRYMIGGPLAFGPSTDSLTWNLQSVVVDGRDLTDLPVEIEAGNSPKQILVTYGDRFQELSGRVQSSSGAPVNDLTILVFPEDRNYWIQGSRRIAIARPATDGLFMLSGRGPMTLPPGRYLLAAVDDIAKDEQFDPAFLAQLVPSAVSIVLNPGEKKVQNLAVR